MAKPPHQMIQHADDTAHEGLAELQARLNAGKRNERAKDINEQLDDGDIEDRIAAGVAKGFALVLADEGLVKSFWHKGYLEVSAHSINGASQWFGKRLFIMAVGLIVTWGLIVLIRNGAIK